MIPGVAKDTTPVGVWYYVYCMNEDCEVRPRTKSLNRKEYAIMAWNTREGD